MKITFVQNPPTSFDRPFAVYRGDPALEHEPLYIDIKSIVREKVWVWLDALQAEHATISARFLRHTRWWWVTPMARLDLRPWGQDYLVEPLFFARALVEWTGKNPGHPEVVLVGCDPLVAVYLKELGIGPDFRGNRKINTGLVLAKRACRNSVMAFCKIFIVAKNIVALHLFKRRYHDKIKTLIVSESVLDNSFASGYEFFYKGLFDDVLTSGQGSAVYACLNEKAASFPANGTHAAGQRFFFLLDGIGVGALAKSFLRSVGLVVSTVLVALRGNSFFWAHFLLSELGKGYYLRNICVYSAMKTFLAASGCKTVVYPYEEKGIEKAILYACREEGVSAIGYLPHPQYRLALAMRDKFEPLSPKPDKYAVSGAAYADYLVDWALKKRQNVEVWGSNKYARNMLSAHRLDRSRLKVLLLISHPDELEVFRGWLKAEAGLARGASYVVRVYKAGSPRRFDGLIRAMEKEFDFVGESRGTLEEDLKNCDVAIFCATSAGLTAINSGRIALYVDLKNLLPINPCFDDLGPVSGGKTCRELAERLDALCRMSRDELAGMHEKQLLLAERIFSAPQEKLIKERLS